MPTKRVSQKTMMLGGSLVMLFATLLPLVNLKSYRWNILELPHKIDRLVDNATYNTAGKVLVFALVLFPIVVALTAVLRRCVPKVVALLPLLVALALIVILFIAGRPAPGIGLWLYALAATATLATAFKK